MDSSPHNPLNKWERMSNLVDSDSNLTQAFINLSIIRFLAENILVFLLQYIGLTLALSSHFAPIWFASGTMCAFVFLRGYSVIPGIWLGSISAYYFFKYPVYVAIQYATVYALQAFLILWLNYRFLTPTLLFNTRKIFIKFIIFAAILTYFISFMIHQLDYTSMTWMQSWLANFNGIIIFSCALIAWDAYFPDIYQIKQLNRSLLLLFFGGVLLSTILLLLSETPIWIMSITFFTLMLIIIISRLYGWCGTLAATFIFAFFLNLGAYLNTPLFVTSLSTNMINFVQTLLSLTTILALLFSIPSKKS